MKKRKKKTLEYKKRKLLFDEHSMKKIPVSAKSSLTVYRPFLYREPRHYSEIVSLLGYIPYHSETRIQSKYYVLWSNRSGKVPLEHYWDSEVEPRDYGDGYLPPGRVFQRKRLDRPSVKKYTIRMV